MGCGGTSRANAEFKKRKTLVAQVTVEVSKYNSFSGERNNTLE